MSGLRGIENIAVTGKFTKEPELKGKVTAINIMDDYIQHLLSYVNLSDLQPLKIVVNAGNGCAGKAPTLQVHKSTYQPDGTFPNSIPNPLLPENRGSSASIVRETGADIGIAWDGGFDRCFFFDAEGNFIKGYYIVGFLAQAFLNRQPGSKIIHDPRLTWNTVEVVKQLGGIPVQSKTGHAFIKERMRQEDAIYGGEMSAHHYFKDFSYCDSGMIPWLLIVDVMSRTGKALSTLVNERVTKFPCSGEINRHVADAKLVMQRVEEKFATADAVIDRTDGVSVEYPTWRFNLRSSNTEPVIRLNVESRGDVEFMTNKTDERYRQDSFANSFAVQ